MLYIIVVTDTIYSVRHIFDSSSHSYQLQSIAIAQDLRSFFENNTYNSIEFWDCPSNAKWVHHLIVDKETKKYNLKPIFLCKLSWEFSMKNECDSIIWNWQMTFQVSDFKENHFLDLLNDKCYDLGLGSGCNLGKDLSREGEMINW